MLIDEQRFPLGILGFVVEKKKHAFIHLKKKKKIYVFYIYIYFGPSRSVFFLIVSLLFFYFFKICDAAFWRF